MCGRFERSSPIERIASKFNITQARLIVEPSYNIAPSQNILVIIEQGTRQFMSCRWGFIPSWAKDPSIGHKMINARAETVASKPAFRSAFRKHRCLIVANGFYEWQKTERKKVPYYIRLKSGEPFGFAGIYSTWVSDTAESIDSCAIITTDANDLIRDVHERMPVIIPHDKVDHWLNDVTNQATLLEMLRPYPAEEMQMYEVSTKVNSPTYDSPDVIEPSMKKI